MTADQYSNFGPSKNGYIVSVDDEGAMMRVLDHCGYRVDQKGSNNGMDEVLEYTSQIRALPFLPHRQVRVTRILYVHTKLVFLEN